MLTKTFLTYSLALVIVSCLLWSSSSNLFVRKSPLTHINSREKINAFIITHHCNSTRYQTTKANIERVFPNYFQIHCFQSISLNDSRIHTSSSTVLKKFSSNLLSFVLLWTYAIPKYAVYADEQWSFVFEDDVNFIPPSSVALTNYIGILEEMMNNFEVHYQDRLFYLGICGPTFTANKSRSLISQYSKNHLSSSKGYGWCAHAMGLTTRRAKDFWSEISLYRPTPDAAIDFFLREYCIRSGQQYYTLGSNIHWPPSTGHYGIAFQDRGRFPSGMN